MPERLWVALDVETLKEADGLLERLAGAGPPETMGAKIGSQLFTAAGPAAVATALRPAERVDDQKRVATPADAIRAGADAIVVGRPITAVPDPRAAAAAILSEIAAAAV